MADTDFRFADKTLVVVIAEGSIDLLSITTDEVIIQLRLLIVICILSQKRQFSVLITKNETHRRYYFSVILFIFLEGLKDTFESNFHNK